MIGVTVGVVWCLCFGTTGGPPDHRLGGNRASRRGWSTARVGVRVLRRHGSTTRCVTPGWSPLPSSWPGQHTWNESAIRIMWNRGANRILRHVVRYLFVGGSRCVPVCIGDHLFGCVGKREALSGRRCFACGNRPGIAFRDCPDYRTVALSVVGWGTVGCLESRMGQLLRRRERVTARVGAGKTTYG